MSCRPALLLALLATPVLAQRSAEPHIVLSVFGGVAGGTALWTVDRQPLLVPGTAGTLSPVYDTVRLGRRLQTGLMAGVNVTYFTSRHFGIQGEIALLQHLVDDSCAMLNEQGGLLSAQNRELCADLSATGRISDAIAIQLGAIARGSPARLTPYVRAQGGFTSRSASLAAVTGRFTALTDSTVTERAVYLDRGGRTLGPTLAFGGGITAEVSRGTQLRLELRDQIVQVPEITGPAGVTNPGLPPVEDRFVHHLSLTLQFDIVLEHRRSATP